MTRLSLKLLGSYRLTIDDLPIEALESDKARALLAYLALENGRPHPREKLVGIFWPEQDEEHARGNLSQALYHLRGVLGDRPLTGALPAGASTQAREPSLLVTPQEIQLNPKCDFQTDVAAFFEKLAACKAHAHSLYEICEDCLERCEEAARLYTGDFLDGFYLPKSIAFEEWATVLREQLRQDAMEVLEHLVVAFERQGELEQALGYARKMVQLDELGEAGNQHMIRLLALIGRRGDALSHYAHFRQALAVQMGAEPGMEVTMLYHHLRSEAAGTDLSNLPASLTPFVGRRQELDTLWGWISNPKHRLICILGTGGSGKTRLAIEAAHKQCYHFRDGIYFVPLSALGAGSSLLAAIADGLGFSFREGGDPKRLLLDYLRHKRALLVLDSFETVVKHAGLVAELLSVSPGSKALVTTRVRLNLSGEQVFPLEGMRVPPIDAAGQVLDYSSVEMFLEAARRVKPGYMPDNLDDVASICRLVEGMPLSLLLASTWVSDYPIQEIVAQISRSLDFLSVEWADLPERQRSLRATFEYSWNLLSPCEQQVLMKLSVFRLPFTARAAAQVASASAQLLHTLVGKSLLGSTTEGQYQMHDLVRQYSAEKLAHASDGQECTARQQHCEYFLERAAGWSTTFKGAQKSVMLAQADKMIDDVQAAWEWAAGHADVERLSRALEGILMHYNLRYRYTEGEHACQLALQALASMEVTGERLGLEGWLLAWQARFCREVGKVEPTRQLLHASQEKLSQAEAAGHDVRLGQALLWSVRGDFVSGLSERLYWYQRSAALFQVLGETMRYAAMLCAMGDITNGLGNHRLGMELHHEALELSRALGEPRQLANALVCLAYDNLAFGPWETGARLMEEAAGILQAKGDPGSQGDAELFLGTSLGWVGRYAEACELLERALEKLRQVGDRYHITYGMAGLGMCELELGEYAKAASALQVALEAARRDEFNREEALTLAWLGCVALVQGDIPRALTTIEESIFNYRHMQFTDELGSALSMLALAQHIDGQEVQAWDSFREALHVVVENYSRFTLSALPAALVVLLADTGRWEQAVEAYSAVMTDPIVSNSCWFADMVGNRMDLAREKLPEDVFQDAEARGLKGDLFEVLGRLAQEIYAWSITPGE
jgi:DNA-binding SARP family transcriptional activator/predicted ATPase